MRSSVFLRVCACLAAVGALPTGARADSVVAQDGSGDYKTVQAALDAVPSGNAKPFVITLKPGVYREKLTVPKDKPFIRLVGSGAGATTLTWGDYARMTGPDGQPIGTSKTFSLTVLGHDFEADDLTVENSAAPRAAVGQAVALAVDADRCVVRRCHLRSLQDTLYANKGREYFQDCRITGDVDFIFGNAAAVFDGCTIESVGKGYVTAQSRTDATQTTGYVLDHCTLTGAAPAGSVALGRPWRPYARVVYLGCTLGPQIDPAGWHDWSAADRDREQTVFYAEYNDRTSDGKPVDAARRVPWSHQLTAAEAAPFVPAAFLKGDDGWNPGAPATLDTATTTPSAASLDIPSPQIPDRAFSVTDYGAVGDGKTPCTAALQKAIAACSAAGGGTVRVPTGRFLTGPFTLVSHLNLHLDAGATLLMSDRLADYLVTNNRFQNCISADGCDDVAITGGGTIDGQGAIWWAHYVNHGPHRPFLVVLNRCRRVLIQGVTLQNSPMFHLVPQRCQDVRIDGVHIAAPETAKNTDGLDPSGWRFLITGCTFNVGDDCIALKPGGRIAEDQPACRDFTIINCQFLHGHGLSVGGQTPGGLDGLTVRDCTFQGTDAGIRLKASRGSGGLVENLTYEDLTMIGVKNTLDITSYYNGNSPGTGKVDVTRDPAQPVGTTTPIWRHIRISNVTSTGGASAGRILGLPEMPVSDVVLTNVKIGADKGLQVTHARGIRFANSQITAAKGAPLVAEDADVTGLGAVAARSFAR